MKKQYRDALEVLIAMACELLDFSFSAYNFVSLESPVLTFNSFGRSLIGLNIEPCETYIHREIKPIKVQPVKIHKNNTNNQFDCYHHHLCLF